MQLYPHQLKAVAEVYDKIKEGYKRIILASCTGSGKTVMMSRITADALKVGRKVLITVDDSPLIKQTLDKLNKFGIEAGVIKAGYAPDPTKLVQVASIDTLIRRQMPEGFNLILVDECHYSYAKKYDKLFEFYNEAIFVGFSATPQRTSRKESLLKRWQTMVRGLTIMEAVMAGYNVMPVVYSIKRHVLGLDNIKVKGGDYDREELSLAMRSPEIMNLAVDSWEKYGENLRTIGFCVDIQHSKDLCDLFNKRGIPAAQLDGDTSDKDREKLYKKLLYKEISVLTSVNVLSIGFDMPAVGCVLSCRPTKSHVVWPQQVGRALRVFPEQDWIFPDDKKERAIIIDQAENTFNICHPLEYVPPELEAPNKATKPAPVKVCPDCGVVCLAFMKQCPECGHVFPGKKKLTTHGELELVTPAMKIPTIAAQVYAYKKFAQEAWLKRWNPDYAVMKFKELYGYYPKREYKLHAIFGEDVSNATILNFFSHLKTIAKNKGKDSSWLKRKLTEEFGSIDPSILSTDQYEIIRYSQDVG